MENTTKLANETKAVKVAEPKQIVEADGFVIAAYTYEMGKDETRVTFSFEFNDDYHRGGILSKRSDGRKGTLEIVTYEENSMILFRLEKSRNPDDWTSMGFRIDSRLNEDVLKLGRANRSSEENVAATLLGKAAACLKDEMARKKWAEREIVMSQCDDIKNAMDHRRNAFALARRIDDGLQGIKHEKDAY
jgi:hypothetical protein